MHKYTTDRFSSTNNDLMRNTMLQIFPLIFVSSALIMTTTSDFVFGLSMCSLCLSVMISLLAEASYESDNEHYGLYHPITKLYDNLIVASAFTLLFALFIHMYNFPHGAQATKLSFCIIIVMVYSTLHSFYLRRKEV